MCKNITQRLLFIATSLFFTSVMTAHASGLNDTIPPATPTLKYITVTPQTGNTTLYWSPSPDGDVLGYVIYRNQNDVWIALDSLFNADDSVYTDITSRALFFAESYVIAAFDTTRNVSPLTAPHTTVFLGGLFDSCTAAISLNWSSYGGWNEPGSYRIMMKEETGIYNPVDTVPSDKTNDTVNLIPAGITYCFYITAVHPDGFESSSNGICLAANMLQPPGYITANGAIVTGGKDVVLSFRPDPAGELTRFILYRRSSLSAPWDSITNLSSTPGMLIEITDRTDSVTSPLYYTLAAVNPCGKAITWSNTATAMWLTGVNDGFNNFLRWTPYRDFPEGVDHYSVYRQSNNLAWDEVATLNGTDTSYADNIETLQYLPEHKGVYCYYLEAYGKNSSAYPDPLLGRSTVVCMTGQFSVFIPNAFTPDNDGINDYFAPSLSFSPVTYQLIIRNRWGIILFETNDYLKKWDGRDLKGNPVKEGTYTYTVRATTPENKTIMRSGTVTVIFP